MATMVEKDAERRADGEALGGESGSEKRGRRKLVLPIIAIVVLVALVWGVKELLYARAHESTDDAQVDGHIIPVLAKVGGYVTGVNVEDNDSVKSGESLVRIDDAEYKVHLAQAEADLAAARAAAGVGKGTGQAEAAVATATSQHAALAAQIAAARAEADNAQSNLARMKELVAKHIVSQQQLDAAQAAADAATANLQAVERQAAAGGAGVAGAQAGVRVAQARLEAAQAQRDNAALQLGYTNITAPVAGTVSKKLVEVGQLVQPGQTLMSVVSDTGTWITANFKETQLSDMRVGQPTEIDVDAYPGCQAEGRVESLSPATGAKFALLPPDNATGNFTKVVQRVPVRIQITKGCGAGRPLRPGLSVTAHVKTK
ncbi:MAG TPA: HlyD family secretion protein [Gemmatimonadaceae bacterium]|nr:HlyD family secretion protein [Gemmatimonadaceae bacterium]